MHLRMYGGKEVVYTAHTKKRLCRRFFSSWLCGMKFEPQFLTLVMVHHSFKKVLTTAMTTNMPDCSNLFFTNNIPKNYRAE